MDKSFWLEQAEQHGRRALYFSFFGYAKSVLDYKNPSLENLRQEIREVSNIIDDESLPYFPKEKAPVVTQEPTVKNFTSDLTINEMPVEEYLKGEA